MSFVLYSVFDGKVKDDSGKVPLVINIYDNKGLRSICNARSDEELTMFFEDYFWAKNSSHYLRDVGKIDGALERVLNNILCKPEDRRIQKHFEENKKLPKRRERTYETFLPLP